MGTAVEGGMIMTKVDELHMGIAFYRCSECEKIKVIRCHKCVLHDHENDYCEHWKATTYEHDYCSFWESEEAWED